MVYVLEEGGGTGRAIQHKDLEPPNFHCLLDCLGLVVKPGTRESVHNSKLRDTEWSGQLSAPLLRAFQPCKNQGWSAPY